MPKVAEPATPPLTLTLDEAGLERLAAALGRVLKPGCCIALWGDLGAGKTTFARALIRALLADPAHEVPSPTFALRQDYASARGAIVHFDLYRVTDPSELEELGFDEAMASAITLVEWPDRAGTLLPPGCITIALATATSADARTVTLSGLPAALEWPIP